MPPTAIIYCNNIKRFWFVCDRTVTLLNNRTLDSVKSLKRSSSVGTMPRTYVVRPTIEMNSKLLHQCPNISAPQPQKVTLRAHILGQHKLLESPGVT